MSGRQHKRAGKSSQPLMTSFLSLKPPAAQRSPKWRRPEASRKRKLPRFMSANTFGAPGQDYRPGASKGSYGYRSSHTPRGLQSGPRYARGGPKPKQRRSWSKAETLELKERLLCGQSLVDAAGSLGIGIDDVRAEYNYLKKIGQVRSNLNESSAVPAGAIGGSMDGAVAHGATAGDAGEELSEEQRSVLSMVLSGESVFFTGSAGTGKSFVLRRIVDALRKTRHSEDAVQVTASTGMAAVNVGGRTLHSFAGIGLGNGSAQSLVGRVMGSDKARRRWRETEVLVIDEISMLDAELFDKLERIARAVRQRERPFGGIQLVLCGDFLQLPPVTRGGSPRFCFQAKTWTSCIGHEVMLKRVFRQKNQNFVGMLNELRVGRCSPHALETLRARVHRKLPTADGIVPTRLYAIKRAVRLENEDQLRRLRGELRIYTAIDRGEPSQVRALERYCAAETQLRLKVGAQVMMLKNQPEKGLFNGSRGVVTGFRVRTGNFGIEEHVPVVRFFSGAQYDVCREEWNIQDGAKIVASRLQIPLMLAWALTIHKCQGMTIDKAEMALSGCFEYGQFYVGISRIRSLEGLSLTSFDASRIKAHPRVIDYYKTFGSRRCSSIGQAGPAPPQRAPQVSWTPKIQGESMSASWRKPRSSFIPTSAGFKPASTMIKQSPSTHGPGSTAFRSKSPPLRLKPTAANREPALFQRDSETFEHKPAAPKLIAQKTKASPPFSVDLTRDEWEVKDPYEDDEEALLQSLHEVETRKRTTESCKTLVQEQTLGAAERLEKLRAKKKKRSSLQRAGQA